MQPPAPRRRAHRLSHALHVSLPPASASEHATADACAGRVEAKACGALAAGKVQSSGGGHSQEKRASAPQPFATAKPVRSALPPAIAPRCARSLAPAATFRGPSAPGRSEASRMISSLSRARGASGAAAAAQRAPQHQQLSAWRPARPVGLSGERRVARQRGARAAPTAAAALQCTHGPALPAQPAPYAVTPSHVCTHPYAAHTSQAGGGASLSCRAPRCGRCAPLRRDVAALLCSADTLLRAACGCANMRWDLSHALPVVVCM